MSSIASADIIFTFDENGNGVGVNTAGPFTIGIHGTLQADPGPGGLASVLTYSLQNPPSLVAGDLLFQDGIGGPILDVVRFNPAGTGSAGYAASLLFYSDNTDGFDSLGDTPSPPSALYANVVTLQEIGPEGNNGVTYTPTAGQPGFIAGFTVTYNLRSDGTIPEPASVSLLGGVVIAAIAMIKKRRSLSGS